MNKTPLETTLLDETGVDITRVGFRRPGQVDPLVGAGDLRLDASDLTTTEQRD
jgi:hypothetical protein